MVNRPDRPGGLDFRSNSFDPAGNPTSNASASNLSLGDLPSPRAGEVPPALSPLDALALQGRLLAKRFEQENKNGRRMSRLAPLTIQNEFGSRPGYFSSLSNSTVNSPNEDIPDASPRNQQSPNEQVLIDRHRSYYPQFGHDDDDAEDEDEDEVQVVATKKGLSPIGETQSIASPPRDYFDIPRTSSPEPVEPAQPVEPSIGLQEATPVTPHMPQAQDHPFLNSQRQLPQPPSLDTLSLQPHTGLVPPPPPKSPMRGMSPRRGVSPSIRSVAAEGSDVAREEMRCSRRDGR